MTTRMIQRGEVGADYVGSSNKTRQLFHDHGVTWVGRYVKPGVSPYELTISERDGLWAMGIAIVLVFERNESSILGGAKQGAIDGVLAAQDCRVLGYPVTCPIWAAVDTDVVVRNSGACNDYLRAFYNASRPWPDGGYFDTEGYLLVRDLDPSWCKPNASGWDQHPELRGLAHVLQGRQDRALGWDYPNIVQRSFRAWTGLGVDAPTIPPVVTPPATTPLPPIVVVPPAVADSASPVSAMGDEMFLFYNSDAPDDTRRFLSNGMTYRHVDEDTANKLNLIGVSKTPVAEAIPLSTVQIADMTDVTKVAVS